MSDRQSVPLDENRIVQLIRQCRTGMLVLRAQRIDDNTTRLLSRSLRHYGLNRVTKLDLVRNLITSVGVKVIANQLLTQFEVLTSLNLSHNNIENTGAEILADALRSNQSLSVLLLAHCHISDQGALAFADCFEENQTLKQLNLQFNEISDVGGNALFSSLRANSALEVLKIDGNRIHGQLQRNFIRTLSLRTSLEVTEPISPGDRNVFNNNSRDISPPARFGVANEVINTRRSSQGKRIQMDFSPSPISRPSSAKLRSRPSQDNNVADQSPVAVRPRSTSAPKSRSDRDIHQNQQPQQRSSSATRARVFSRYEDEEDENVVEESAILSPVRSRSAPKRGVVVPSSREKPSSVDRRGEQQRQVSDREKARRLQEVQIQELQEQVKQQKLLKQQEKQQEKQLEKERLQALTEKQQQKKESQQKKVAEKPAPEKRTEEGEEEVEDSMINGTRLLIDPKTGKKLRFNPSTGEISWAVSQRVPLPQNPNQNESENADDFIPEGYVTPPDVRRAIATARARETDGSLHHSKLSAPSPLPSHLKIHIDPLTNQRFAYNTATGISTWLDDPIRASSSRNSPGPTLMDTLQSFDDSNNSEISGEIISGTAASRSGSVQEGDRIVSISGKQVSADSSARECEALLSGPPGSLVSITIRRSATSEHTLILMRGSKSWLDNWEARVHQVYSLVNKNSQIQGALLESETRRNQENSAWEEQRNRWLEEKEQLKLELSRSKEKVEFLAREVERNAQQRDMQTNRSESPQKLAFSPPQLSPSPISSRVDPSKANAGIDSSNGNFSSHPNDQTRSAQTYSYGQNNNAVGFVSSSGRRSPPNSQNRSASMQQPQQPQQQQIQSQDYQQSFSSRPYSSSAPLSRPSSQPARALVDTEVEGMSIRSQYSSMGAPVPAVAPTPTAPPSIAFMYQHPQLSSFAPSSIPQQQQQQLRSNVNSNSDYRALSPPRANAQDVLSPSVQAVLSPGGQEQIAQVVKTLEEQRMRWVQGRQKMMQTLEETLQFSVGK